MGLIKKMDKFILKSYVLIFAGTFFICLFIFMMQFLWRWIEDLVGKNLTIDVLIQFFFYSALTLVPISMPLAVLLASLISFGNMGEQLELLSMKSSGIPLIRILQPVMIFVLMVCGASFLFQNNIGPEATKQLATMAWSLKQKSPEAEIPEGIFYSEIPGYNIYVERKDPETGLLTGVMIYRMSAGYEDAEIVLADSALLQSTADKRHLKLTLYNGERFRNIDTQSGNTLRANVPYMRESFIREVNLIRFDANFNLMDANLFSGNAQTKNIVEIRQGIDSLQTVADSTGKAIYSSVMANLMRSSLPVKIKDSTDIVKRIQAENLPLDTFYRKLSAEQQAQAWQNAYQYAENMKSEYDFHAIITRDTNASLRRHQMEVQRKFTLTLACLLFFFIGAPLGAIIRKGGLGVPVVVSVIIFIFYYIVNVGSEKMAKTGDWAVWCGMWTSSAILLPVGVFLTNRANKDSAVFNMEAYKRFVSKMLGVRPRRTIDKKEVIIYNPEYRKILTQLSDLSAQCQDYSKKAALLRMPNYFRVFFKKAAVDHKVAQMSEQLEDIVEQLHNSQDAYILSQINTYPYLSSQAHLRPFERFELNVFTGLVFPVGIYIWIRIWRYRLRLWKDMQRIQNINQQITKRIIKKNYE